jgi:large subunit ribosomal protein L21e
MLKRKRMRQRGKLSFSKFFQTFEPGDLIAVVRELGQKFGYKNRLQGRTGRVIEKRGSAYYIEIKDHNKPKKYLLRPIHLKKIKA